MKTILLIKNQRQKRIDIVSLAKNETAHVKVVQDKIHLDFNQ